MWLEIVNGKLMFEINTEAWKDTLNFFSNQERYISLI